jgi:TolB-like protein/Tfp pilus assembly protein PilF
MPNETTSNLKFEIGHVLFIDIVGYSKLLIKEQSEQLQTLKTIVRGTEQFRLAEAQGKLLRLPTGDGGALVFRNSPEAAARCALEITRELQKPPGSKEKPQLRLRMGIHSGPVNEVVDLNEQSNIAGAGINIAQRVMDCADAGHILLSKHVAEDLEEYEQWRPLLHDLGTCEVKHGVRIGVANLYDSEIGNPHLPKKFQAIKTQRTRVRWAAVAIGLLVVAALAAAVLSFLRKGPARSFATAVEKSIAVLPFENLSRDPDNAFFSDGVQDEILTNLSRIADLKVISRTSVMQYKSGLARNLREIGQQLGVAHVVEGSVQRAANKVRVNAQLLDARTDAHLWAQTYDRDLADVFAIQSEIAKAIADQLQAKLSPAEKKAIERPPTSDLTAFDLYTRAKNIILRFGGSAANERTNHLQAIDLLNQAVAQDPSFFDAYCQLAWVHDGLYFLGYDHTSARLALAEAAIQAAFRLRPDAGEAHLAEAQNLYQGYLDYDGALTELDVARQTLPNDPRIFLWKGLIERRQGRWEESTQDLERAIELDPRNFFTLGNTALSYEALRRYTQEKSMYDRVLAFEPNDPVRKVQQALVEFDSKADTRLLHKVIDSIRATNPAAISTIADAWLLCALAERDDAAAKNALMALGENPSNLGLTDNVLFNCPLVEGIIARMTKDDGKARSAFTAARARQEEIVRAQPNYGPAMCALGLIDAGLGRKEEALREGRRAVELLPVEKDALNGSGMIKYLAMIAAWAGDKDTACEQLAIAIRSPSGLSYGQLKLLPLWDPLRGDPRFEKVVEEAKQPVALK